MSYEQRLLRDIFRHIPPEQQPKLITSIMGSAATIAVIAPAAAAQTAPADVSVDAAGEQADGTIRVSSNYNIADGASIVGANARSLAPLAGSWTPAQVTASQRAALRLNANSWSTWIYVDEDHPSLEIGHPGHIDITNTGAITTTNAYGIFATTEGLLGDNWVHDRRLAFFGDVHQYAGFGGDAGDIAITNHGVLSTSNVAIAAISQGGDGGHSVHASYNGGREQGGAIGGYGGAGGNITINNVASGAITTTGYWSEGIFAASIGGRGGDGVSGRSAWDDGGNGGAGGIVKVTNAAAIRTLGDHSTGIAARSSGGLAGNGVGSGHGGEGTHAAEAYINLTGTGAITTGGARAVGALAESVGGNGGNGGDATASGLFAVAIGGAGGNGGNGGNAHIDISGAIETTGATSAGAYAHSVGGGGGEGGSATVHGVGFGMAVGGRGGAGGDGGAANVTVSGSVTTRAGDSAGVVAQSVGGGGGSGGTAGGATVGFGVSAQVSIGGAGGGGGAGGYTTATINRGASISTGTNPTIPVGAPIPVSAHKDVLSEIGDLLESLVNTVLSGATNAAEIPPEEIYGAHAVGVLAQSIGGGGGNGGSAMAVAASAGTQGSISVAVALGGSGGQGGHGGDVIVSNAGSVATHAASSQGVVAQSIGGGGGNGGNAMSVAATASAGYSAAVSVALGGSGGLGGHGATVTVGNSGSVSTDKSQSNGVLVQSVGGGGGNGGQAVTVSAAVGKQTGTIGVTLGGSGGSGGYGDAATFTQQAGGSISTRGNSSNGVVVQSVGGGGGNGGSAHAYAASVSTAQGSEPGDAGGKSLALNVGLGGSGGSGGSGGTAALTAAGSITTLGDNARGAIVQSIGGGGGNGGNVSEVSLSVAQNGVPNETGKNGGKSAAVNVGVGGAGGNGDNGGAATFTGKSGLILTTSGAHSDGVLVQSIGGGGGNGGNVHSVEFSGMAPNPGAGDGGKKSGTSLDVSIGLGGTGGYGVNGGSAEADLEAGVSIATKGAASHGVVVQSVGAGGGSGGSVNNLNGFGYRTRALSLGIGGYGAMSGDGGAATFKGGVAGGAASTITTSGAHANALMLQSIGGGGGMGGSVSSGNLTEAFGLGANNSDKSKSVRVTGANGAQGTGGTINVLGDVRLTTTGEQAFGILAQSVGGGGGHAHAIGQIDATGGNELKVGGDGSGGGNGGLVTIAGSGAITTSGAMAHGIVAQSIGGGGGNAGISLGDGVPASGSSGMVMTVGGYNNSGGNGDEVFVRRAGSITTHGAHAIGVIAQSIGGGGGLGNLGANVLGADPTKGADLYIGAYGRGGSWGINISDAVSDGVASPLDVSTDGVGAYGIFAQSVGGGGGLVVSNDDNPIHLVLAPAMSNAQLRDRNQPEIYGTGGPVIIKNRGVLTTRGDFATAIRAISVSSGGVVVDTNTGSAFQPRWDGEQHGAGSVDITQAGAITTSGKSAHGIDVYAQGGSANNINVTVNGSIHTTGAGSYGVTTYNEYVGWMQRQDQQGLNASDLYTSRITVNAAGSVIVDKADAIAINVADMWGKTFMNIGGAVKNTAAVRDNTAVAIRSMNNAWGGGVSVWQGASVLGEITGGNYKLYNAGTITGSVTGVSDYENQATGVHNLVVDPAHGFMNVVWGNTIKSSGKINLVLGSFGDIAGYRPLLQRTQSNMLMRAELGLGIGLANISTPLAVDFGLKVEDNNRMITVNSAKVHFAGVNMDRNSEAIAASADRLVDFLVSNGDGALAQYGALHDHLLAAANAQTLADLQAKLAVFDTTDDTHAATDYVSAQSAVTTAAHSCGTADGDYASIHEAECSWARVSTKSVDHDGPGETSRMDSLTFGRQVAIDTNWRAGFALAYGQDEYRTGSSVGEGDRYHASAVVKRIDGPWLASGAVTASYGDSQYAREIDNFGVREIARSNQKLFSVASRFKAARVYEVGALDIRPGIAFDAVWLHNYGYDETGSGLASAHVNAHSQVLYDITPSVRVGADLKEPGGFTVRPYVQAGVDWALNDAETEVLVASLETATLTDNRAGLIPEFGAGLSLLKSDTFEARLEYEGAYADDYTAQTVSLKVGARF